MRADELAERLHGYTGIVVHDTEGTLYVPALAAGVPHWVEIGHTAPIGPLPAVLTPDDISTAVPEAGPLTLIDEAVARLSHWAAHLPPLPDGFRYEFDLRQTPEGTIVDDAIGVVMRATPTALTPTAGPE